MANSSSNKTSLDAIVALCKRRGIVYPGSEIYGGISGMWDYGPLGVALKENITHSWLRKFVEGRGDMYRVDAAVVTHARVFEASGHAEGFQDPLSECAACHERFRDDQIAENKCPTCGGEAGASRPFNMMFATHVGATRDAASLAYLRPETAQGIFVNFKNIIDSFHPKLPFGIAQIGKAFRNEIAPRDFLFRTREFEQMEIEYFVHPDEWENKEYGFERWRREVSGWLREIGLHESRIHECEVPAHERAHYSARTIDFEYDFPFGRKELCGLAYRSNHDLASHESLSGADLRYFDEASGERFMPHVVEPSFGLDRLALALLADAYAEDDLGGETRVVLRLKPALAPVRAAVFPLLKNKPTLIAKARDVYRDLRHSVPYHRQSIVFDDNGNIGKRYRRQDEIGTPYCITIDFETLENDSVTVRERDSGEQERVKVAELGRYIHAE